MSKNTDTYSGYRYPTEIISHAVWLYFRFTLGFRDVEDLLAYRGVMVSHETIRQWTLKSVRPMPTPLWRPRQPGVGAACLRASSGGMVQKGQL